MFHFSIIFLVCFSATVCEEAIFVPEVGFSVWQLNQDYVCTWIWAQLPLHRVHTLLQFSQLKWSSLLNLSHNDLDCKLHAAQLFFINTLIHQTQYIACHVPLSPSLSRFLDSAQEFWGDGGPDNSRYEDTSAQLSSWSWGLCWRKRQEERERVTQPNTEHREGWAGEPDAFIKMCHSCVLSPSWEENLSFYLLIL